jgi:hypothetical protein
MGIFAGQKVGGAGLFDKVVAWRLPIFKTVQDGIDRLFTVDTFKPQIVWLDNHNRAGLTLFQATRRDNLHIQTAIKNFFFNILKKTVGLLVADPFGVAF